MRLPCSRRSPSGHRTLSLDEFTCQVKWWQCVCQGLTSPMDAASGSVTGRKNGHAAHWVFIFPWKTFSFTVHQTRKLERLASPAALKQIDV